MVKISILISDREYRDAFISRLPFCDISVGAEIIAEIPSDFIYQESLLLTDKRLTESELALLDRRSIVYLVSDDSMRIIHDKDAYCISKYGQVTDIVTELSQIYADVYNRSDAIKVGGSDLVAVCCNESFDGNIVDVSRFVARQIANVKQCKVLLIPMTELNPFVYDGDGGGLERLVYSLASNRCISVGYFFVRDEYGVSNIKCNEKVNRISRMNEEESSWLMRKLSDFFPVIVMHIGSCMTDLNLKRISSSKAVFSVGADNSALQDILPGYPDDKYLELKWNSGNENYEMDAVDHVTQIFGPRQ